MNIEGTIYKFLDRHYELILNKSHDENDDLNPFILSARYTFRNKINNNVSKEDKFKEDIDKIYPDDIYGSLKYIDLWVLKHKDILEKDVIDFYILNKNKKFSDILSEATMKFMVSDKYTKTFIDYSLSRIHYHKVVEPVLESLVKKNIHLSFNQINDKINKKFKSGDSKLNSTITNFIKHYYRVNIYNVKVNKFFDNLDLSVGSIEIETNISKVLKEDITVFGGDIYSKFKNIYIEKYLNNKIENYLNSCSRTDMTSNKLLNGFDGLYKESPTYYQIIIDKLNDWYKVNFIQDKVDDLLSQLVITMGPRNWIVTWIGHGPFDKSKMITALNEHPSNTGFIGKFYDDWYSNAVIDASTRMMERDKFSRNF